VSRPKQRVAWLVLDDMGWPCSWKPKAITVDPQAAEEIEAEAPFVVRVTYQWPPKKGRRP